MTTQRIEDGVKWKQWWIRYAEFEGKYLSLNDWSLGVPPYSEGYYLRYHVCQDPYNNKLCEQNIIYTGDSLDEALAAFHKAEAEMINGSNSPVSAY